MQCPKCGSHRIRVSMTAYTGDAQIVRRRWCDGCGERWYTLQAPETLLDKEAFRWTAQGKYRRAVALQALTTAPDSTP